MISNQFLSLKTLYCYYFSVFSVFSVFNGIKDKVISRNNRIITFVIVYLMSMSNAIAENENYCSHLLLGNETSNIERSQHSSIESMLRAINFKLNILNCDLSKPPTDTCQLSLVSNSIAGGFISSPIFFDSSSIIQIEKKIVMYDEYKEFTQRQIINKDVFEKRRCRLAGIYINLLIDTKINHMILEYSRLRYFSESINSIYFQEETNIDPALGQQSEKMPPSEEHVEFAPEFVTVRTSANANLNTPKCD